MTYGCVITHGTVSQDPRQFSTKPMTEEMYQLGGES